MHANKGKKAHIFILHWSVLTGDLPETRINKRPPPLASWDKGMIIACSSAVILTRYFSE